MTFRPGEDFTVLAPDERLWAAVRAPGVLLRDADAEGDEEEAGPLDRPGRPVRVAGFDSAEELPRVPGGLGIVRTLLIDAADLPAEDGFLREWVEGGGHLILSLSATGELPDWVPLTAGAPVPLTARGALERIAKSGSARGTAAVINRLAPASARPLDPAGVTAADGRVRATGDGGALVAEVPAGFGRVTVVASSLHEAPLSRWGGLPDFLLELTRPAPGSAAAGKAAPAGELAGQVYAALEDGGARGASPGVVGVWTLGLLLLVGPVDYLLVHRLLGRPALTWLTLPAWLAAATGLAVWSAGEADPTPRRLEIVDFDAASGRVRGTAWAVAPAPDAGRLTVRFEPSDAAGGGNADARLGYAAEPGATFGGLYRGGGTGLVPGAYAVSGGTAEAVPLPERSAKRFRLDWRADGAGAPVAASLTSDGGALRGAVEHTLPGALTDFFLVHDGRVYRPDPAAGDAALPPNAAWRPDGAGVLRRDLRGFLTQVREVREGRRPLAGGPADPADPLKMNETQRLVRTRYAARSRDFGVILPAVSLYAQSGGAAFTTLSNAELEPLDLSAAAASGRALLLGRLDAPLTKLSVDFGPAAAGGEAETTTYVRILLPVADGPADAAPPPPAAGPVRFGPDADTDAAVRPRRRPAD